MVVATILSFGTIAPRGVELAPLHVRWDGHANGSAGWCCGGPLEDKHYVDVTVSSLHWCFVVAAWLPLSLPVYWLPRWS